MPSRKAASRRTAPVAKPVTVAPIETAPEVDVPIEPAPEVVVVEAVSPPAIEAAQETAPTIAASGTVMLGEVCARARVFPLDEVLASLSPDGLDRIANSQSSAAVLKLAERMLANEGDYTPPVFTRSQFVPMLNIVDGYDTIAAAQAAGISEIRVLSILSEDVGYSQSYLAQWAGQAAKLPSDEDDDLVWRVNSYYED